jgi:hypothetical protein
MRLRVKHYEDFLPHAIFRIICIICWADPQIARGDFCQKAPVVIRAENAEPVEFKGNIVRREGDRSRGIISNIGMNFS